MANLEKMIRHVRSGRGACLEGMVSVDPYRRAHAVRALVECHQERSDGLRLRAMLASEADPLVRGVLWRALGRFLADLDWLDEHPETDPRLEAVWLSSLTASLDGRRDRIVRQLLEERRYSRDPQVQRAAVIGLRRMGGIQWPGRAEQHAWLEDADPARRQAALLCSWDVHDPVTQDALCGRLDDSMESLVVLAASVFGGGLMRLRYTHWRGLESLAARLTRIMSDDLTEAFARAWLRPVLWTASNAIQVPPWRVVCGPMWPIRRWGLKPLMICTERGQPTRISRAMSETADIQIRRIGLIGLLAFDASQAQPLIETDPCRSIRLGRQLHRDRPRIG